MNKSQVLEELLYRLHSYEISNLSNVLEDIGELELIGAELDSLGVGISEDTFVTGLLRALPKSCDSFIANWVIKENARTINNLISKLMSRIHQEKDEQARKDSEHKAS